MRHGKKIHKLGRGASHRKATLNALAVALIEHKHIRTTLAKARALRPFVEPLITRAKNDTTHSRRTVFSVLQEKEAVHALFTEIGPKVMDRPGGYTRILKLGPRQGDGAEMALIELVDFNEYLPTTTGKKTTRRSSRRGKKKAGEETTPVAKTPVTTAPEAPAETPAEIETLTEEVPAVEAAAEETIVYTDKTEETPVVEEPTAEAPREPSEEAPKAE